MKDDLLTGLKWLAQAFIMGVGFILSAALMKFALHIGING